MGAARAVLFVRRERWSLTWTGRLLILASLAAVVVIMGRALCGFLAITSPVGGQVLVVEGWMQFMRIVKPRPCFAKEATKRSSQQERPARTKMQTWSCASAPEARS